jgi:hypothetical protein
MAFHPNETTQSKPEQSCQIATRSQSQSTANGKRYPGQQKRNTHNRGYPTAILSSALLTFERILVPDQFGMNVTKFSVKRCF